MNILMILLISISFAGNVESPRIIHHTQKHTIQIKWYEPQTVKTITMKLTNDNQPLPICSDADVAAMLQEWEQAKYCYELDNGVIRAGTYKTVNDRRWNRKTDV